MMTNRIDGFRWLVPPVIAVDTLCTLLGQPASYWVQPLTAQEGNPFFEWFIVRGPSFFVITSLGYILGAFLLASLLPRRLALITSLSYILGHFWGASTWLFYRFDLGVSAVIVYGIVVSTAVVLLWPADPAQAQPPKV